MQLSYLAFAFILYATTTPVATNTPNPLADQLGRVLGLPLDIDFDPSTANDVPEFMENLYECWSANGRKSGDCMAVEDRDMSDVDTVKSFVGKIEVDVLSAVYINKDITNSLAISFNTTSYVRRDAETLRSAQVRVYREALSEGQIAALESKCDLSTANLELYTRVGSDGQKDYMSPEKVISLQKEQLAESQWVVFRDLRQAYPRWMEAGQDSSVSLRVAVGGSCAGIHPAEFGLVSMARKQPLILGFSKRSNADEESRIIARSITQLASGNRAKRQQSVEIPETVYSDHSCRLYPFAITFEELGWESYVVQPDGFTSNFCAGSCVYPITRNHNVTKHSYVQSLAHEQNPDIIPPPCCAPHTTESLTILYRDGVNSAETTTWEDMTATSCGCY